MKIITLTACWRTDELARVLAALIPQLGEWELLIGIDGDCPPVCEVVSRVASGPRVYVLHAQHRFGIQTHQRELVRQALVMGAEAVACLQDDTIPEPDAVAWLDRLLPFGFLHHPALGLTANGGRAVWRPWIDPVGHTGPIPVGSVFCAEGFVASRKVMENLLPHWNGPSDFLDGNGQRYVGWDWSLASAVRRIGLCALVPPSSRIRNIGHDGTHATPADFALVNG